MCSPAGGTRLTESWQGCGGTGAEGNKHEEQRSPRKVFQSFILSTTCRRQRNEAKPFDFYDGIFMKSVWLEISLLILWYLPLFRLSNQHPCFLSNLWSICFINNSKYAHNFFAICRSYTHRLESVVFWWNPVASQWNLVGDLASALIIITWGTGDLE